MLKNKLFPNLFILILVIGAIVFGCAPASTPTATAPASTAAPPPAPVKPVELTFAIADPPTHPDIVNGFQVWANEISKRTNGQVKIVIQAGETLGKASEQWDMVLKGSADITKIVGTHYPGKFPLLDIYSLPFTVPNDAKDKSGKLVRDLVMDKYLAPLYFKDVKVLFVGRYQPNVIHLAKKPVRALEDLKGMIIGNPGGKTNTDLVKALGASAETVKTPDVYTALERGMINGHILPLSTQLSFKFYEVTKYITQANFGSAATVLIMRKETWNNLKPDVQKVIDDLNSYGADLLDKIGADNTAAAAKLVKEKGVEIIDLSPAERTRWVTATKSVEDNWAAEADAKGPASEMLKYVRGLIQ